MSNRASEDCEHMLSALSLARRGIGNTWPNPSVGCVLVREGRVVGRGWTQPGGRPHAETQSLKMAGSAARGATAYVTLEPCSHFGKTPPCAQALIDAGVQRVVAALLDPDERVSGRGMAMLQNAGVTVSVGTCATEAASLNAGYLLRQKTGRPWITLKIATSADGKIATRSGESQWITGESARLFVHRLRAEQDAVAVGIGTVLADNPALTCRLPGWQGYRKGRVVFDSQLRLPLESILASPTKEEPVWVIACEDKIDPSICRRLEGQGVCVIKAPNGGDGRPDLDEALKLLVKNSGITRLFVEGGGTVAAALLNAALVDTLIWFHAPRIIGGDGLSAVAALGKSTLAEAPRLQWMKTEQKDQDSVSFYERME